MTWREQAACAGTDTNAFYPTSKDASPDQAETTAYIRRLCRVFCPVQADCLAEGIRNREHGIWGGYTRQQRDAITRHTQHPKETT